MKEFFKKNWGKVLAVFAGVAALVCIGLQFNRVTRDGREIERLENNLLAANDTLRNYRENGLTIASMRALQLRADELADSLKLERGKTPETIIKYIIRNGDTVKIPVVVVETDTVYTYLRTGKILAERKDRFGKSSREVKVEMPYSVDMDGHLCTDSMDVAMNQDIWVSSSLYKDKEGYTYIQLETDYPSMTFNNGVGVKVDNSESYMKKERRGWGFNVGVQIGYGVNYNRNGIGAGPYLGVGVGFGYSILCNRR